MRRRPPWSNHHRSIIPNCYFYALSAYHRHSRTSRLVKSFSTCSSAHTAIDTFNNLCRMKKKSVILKTARSCLISPNWFPYSPVLHFTASQSTHAQNSMINLVNTCSNNSNQAFQYRHLNCEWMNEWDCSERDNIPFEHHGPIGQCCVCVLVWLCDVSSEMLLWIKQICVERYHFFVSGTRLSNSIVSEIINKGHLRSFDDSRRPSFRCIRLPIEKLFIIFNNVIISIKIARCSHSKSGHSMKLL